MNVTLASTISQTRRMSNINPIKTTMEGIPKEKMGNKRVKENY
jgi:hypothetical protein